MTERPGATTISPEDLTDAAPVDRDRHVVVMLPTKARSGTSSDDEEVRSCPAIESRGGGHSVAVVPAADISSVNGAKRKSGKVREP